MLDRFKKMSISELTHLMWWILQQDHKSEALFSALQKEMQSRVYGMQDEELLLFLDCFVENSSEFSSTLLKAVIKAINKRLTKLSMKAKVGVVWSFARLNLQAEEGIEELFVEVKEEVGKDLKGLQEKEVAILMWAYSKVESPDEEFLERLKAVAIGMNQPKFDNFDLTLIIQACKLFEGTFLLESSHFMSTTMSMLSHLESHIIREVENMNIHQFMTISTYLLMNNIGSDKVTNTLKNQIVKHLEEFDRVQLILLRSSLQKNSLQDNVHLIQTIEAKIRYISKA